MVDKNSLRSCNYLSISYQTMKCSNCKVSIIPDTATYDDPLQPFLMRGLYLRCHACNHEEQIWQDGHHIVTRQGEDMGAISFNKEELDCLLALINRADHIHILNEEEEDLYNKIRVVFERR